MRNIREILNEQQFEELSKAYNGYINKTSKSHSLNESTEIALNNIKSKGKINASQLRSNYSSRSARNSK
jgi:hypothetical protein